MSILLSHIGLTEQTLEVLLGIHTHTELLLSIDIDTPVYRSKVGGEYELLSEKTNYEWYACSHFS